MNDELMRALFPKEMERRDNNQCPFCGEKINMDDFKDDLSKREFEISGICQKCQDDFFTGGLDDD
ncbi:hypothetical protein [Methanobrevibacter sp.]|uniref:hypothetical protein n=1 Tax=Methanobrevibacter sp. TaxID=66852 RepID=UPI00386E783E